MTETRRRLVDHADRLLAERSYNGFSYADLSTALGIRKPSIHYHFPRKQDLVAEVVEVYADGFSSWTERVAERTCAGQLRAYVELFEGFVQRGHGCPTATLAAEIGTLPDEVSTRLHALMLAHVDWLAGVLERGRERGELSFTGPAPEVARLVASSVQGAVLGARTLGIELFRHSTRQLLALLRPAE